MIEEIYKKYLKKGDKIVIGCSGGADSTYLVHKSAEICGDLGIEIIIAHLNHKLRGKDSETDEKFVKELGKILGLKVVTKSKNFKDFSEEKGRKARRKFFEKVLKDEAAKHIVLAHHLDDNIETILMNFVRGSGLSGLSGMKKLHGKILRPLLKIEKEEILKWLKKNKIKFREDKTNKDNSYTRNFYRNLVIPEIKKKNTNLNERLAKSAENFAEIEDFLKTEAQKWLKKGGRTHDLKAFRILHPALQKEILRQLHLQSTGHLQELESKHIDEVSKMLMQSHSGKHKNLGKHTVVEIKGKSFTIKNLFA